MLDREEVHKVSDNMIKHGGSFVKVLGAALRQADWVNEHKIKNAFPDYWEEYKEWGKKWKRLK